MKVLKTPLEGLLVIEPQIFEDARGRLFEVYNKNLFSQAAAAVDFVQDNENYSAFGVIRALHYQKPPYAQAKLVRVASGAVYDVAVDLRFNSPTFGKWFGLELSAQNNKQLFIPRGFAHGMAVLSKGGAQMLYKCDNFYNPQSEGGIIFNDKTLNINWQIEIKKAILSSKDLMLPSFGEYKKNPCF